MTASTPDQNDSAQVAIRVMRAHKAGASVEELVEMAKADPHAVVTVTEDGKITYRSVAPLPMIERVKTAAVLVGLVAAFVGWFAVRAAFILFF